jgi:hypothetical protein
VIIKEDLNLYQKPPEITPDPGQYVDFKTFGYDIKPKIDMGSKYDWKPLNDGPGPGVYDVKDNYKIIGGYIEPEPPRMFTINDARFQQSTAISSPARNVSVERIEEAQNRSMMV